MMASFLTVIKLSISNKTFSKEYYQQVIAQWSLNGWLTEPETEEALTYLDEVFPEEEPSEPEA